MPLPTTHVASIRWFAELGLDDITDPPYGVHPLGSGHH